MTGFRLGTIFGIEIHVHGSWLIIAGLVLWTLASGALPADYPDLSGGLRLVMAAAITALFFVSLLAHELAHSVVATVRGIPVERITFFLFGGMAQTSSDSRTAGEEFLIAIAGPVMSFLLAGLFLFLWYTGGSAGWNGVLVGISAYIAVLNLVLGVFNLLPGYPMDGGRVLRAVIWGTTGDVTRATRWAARVGEGMAYLLIAYGFWEVLTGDAIGGVWLIFIAWFIRNAARTSYRQHLMARMQRVARETFEAHYHRSPFGPGTAWPGGRPGGLREEGRAGGPREEPASPPAGRDVTDMGGPTR